MEANPLICTAEDLAAIRAHAEATVANIRHVLDSDEDHPDADEMMEVLQTYESDIPRLLATVEALRAENDRLRESLLTLAADYEGGVRDYVETHHPEVQ